MLKTYKKNLTKESKAAKKDLTIWDEAISDIRELIKRKKREIAKLTKDIRTLEVLRDSGMEFPEPKTFESTSDLLGQKGDLGQSSTPLEVVIGLKRADDF